MISTCCLCGADESQVPLDPRRCYGHPAGSVRCVSVTECDLRAELRDVRAEIADARAWLDSGPDDPAAIESVVERLLTCGTGPSPEGWSGDAVAVARRDVAEVVRALREADGAVERLRDLRAAVLAVAERMDASILGIDPIAKHAWARALREACALRGALADPISGRELLAALDRVSDETLDAIEDGTES